MDFLNSIMSGIGSMFSSGGKGIMGGLNSLFGGGGSQGAFPVGGALGKTGMGGIGDFLGGNKGGGGGFMDSLSGILGNAFTGESAFGKDGSQGWLNGGASMIGDIGKTYGGMEKVKLGKEQLGFTKDVTKENFNQQIDGANKSKRERYIGSRKQWDGVDASKEEVDKYMLDFGRNKSNL